MLPGRIAPCPVSPFKPPWLSGRTSVCIAYLVVPLSLAPPLPPSRYDDPPQPTEIYVDDETKLTLHGLKQHYVKLQEAQKTRKALDLLDSLEFNQVRLGRAPLASRA